MTLALRGCAAPPALISRGTVRPAGFVRRQIRPRPPLRGADAIPRPPGRPRPDCSPSVQAAPPFASAHSAPANGPAGCPQDTRLFRAGTRGPRPASVGREVQLSRRRGGHSRGPLVINSPGSPAAAARSRGRSRARSRSRRRRGASRRSPGRSRARGASRASAASVPSQQITMPACWEKPMPTPPPWCRLTPRSRRWRS